MTRLEGGFINDVYLVNGVVVKVFGNDQLVGVSSSQRIANETRALNIFGGDIAPRLIRVAKAALHQEFIDGESYETKARRGERVFEAAGRCLKKIHNVCLEKRILHSYYGERFEKAVNMSRSILEFEDISPKFDVLWEFVDQLGVVYIHGDFWLGNIIGKEKESAKVIDWEFSGKGSPYEDFAIAELWIFREFPGSGVEFWQGYGARPNQAAINSFLILRCVEFLATTMLEDYLTENKEGFYHNKISVLRLLCSQDL
ncbi:MAG: aminoglycoside phosphotransferase family protein [Candidatus Yanofskybacteria bacterium]|nr:aminoglycoside phosphotransferase family protein [Candidatus Yanofskybacteria bacterium]